MRLEVRSTSSIEIARALGTYSLDAGVTYLDREPLGAVTAMPTTIDIDTELDRVRRSDGTHVREDAGC